MTPSKAIKYLRDSKLLYIQKGETEYAEADQLGIEALKAVELARRGVSANVYLLLPGETKE